MSVTLAQFYAACPGVVLTRDIDAVLQTLPATASAASIQAAVLPLMPEGNPPQYTEGAPPAVPAIMPGATPVYGAALPPQPTVATPIDGNPVLGTVNLFPWGLPRFADSNPASDGWAINAEAW